jgi:hypothetical protein
VILPQKPLPRDRLGIDKATVHQDRDMPEQVLHIAPDAGLDSGVKLAKAGS